MRRPPAPAATNDWLLTHVRLLADSYRQLTGRVLLPTTSYTAEWAASVYTADFALLSHGLENDPLFNYANRRALDLFELDWPNLLVTPSRASAEAARQDEREAFMRQVREHGFVDHYNGVRISASGRRFTIDDATVWNVVDSQGSFYGQAATFAHWTPLDD